MTHQIHYTINADETFILKNGSLGTYKNIIGIMDDIQFGNSSDVKIRPKQFIEKNMEEFNEMDFSSAIELTSSKSLLDVAIKYQRIYKK